MDVLFHLVRRYETVSQKNIEFVYYCMMNVRSMTQVRRVTMAGCKIANVENKLQLKKIISGEVWDWR